MKNILLVVLLSLFIFGCTSKPVLNVEDGYVPTTASGTKQSIEVAQKAILSAAWRRGWTPRVVKPGLIEANITVRTHEATVEISFNEETYSIYYKSSKNLNYNGNSIHRNYNNWVLNLSKDIQSELGVRSQKY